MSRYSLYSPRKEKIYPKWFAKVITYRNNNWFIVEGVLPVSEVERCDLIYHGHNMTYERCEKEVERLKEEVNVDL